MARRRRKTIVEGGILHSSRKVVKNGDSLIVSLPAEWVQVHRVVPGDVLAMVAIGNFVVISPKPEKREEGG